MTTQNYKNWKVEEDDDHIVWLNIDKEKTATNVLSAEVVNELDSILEALKLSQPRGVVIRSAKENGFIAGADIKEFTRFADENEAGLAIQRGHAIFNKLESLSCPTVALIHGFCLGGGLELSLACRYRIAEDAPSTKLGLPEIRLGIHPGFGGTVRAIETVGVINAMDMMLTGRNLSTRAAKKIGLIDYAVPKRHLINAARQTILKPPALNKTGKKKPFWLPWLNHKLIRPWLAKMLTKKVAKRAPRAQYPAPYALISLWQNHMDNRNTMLTEEANSVARLIIGKTAQNLVRVFNLQEQLKGLGRMDDYTPKHVHVIGGGVMGGDIAAWCALQGYQVTIQDRSHETLARVLKQAFKLYKKRLKKPRLVTAVMDRLMPDINGNGLVRADIVIEAIFEDAEVKRNLYKEIEPRLKDDAIIATNTSSIPLEELSQALNKTERLVGLHFFNPVAKMPLVEIVRGKQSGEDTIAKASAFTKSIKKLPLPVASSPGFLVNRVLMPYLIEAVILADEGVPLKVIDQEAVKFGMPMGPIELADTVGLDICMKVAEILSQSMDISVPDTLRKLVDKKQLGRKTGQGFYAFKNGKPIKPESGKDYSAPTDIQERLILRLVNETVASLRDGVIAEAELADAGVIFGTGFAPFRGGPMHYAADRGNEQVLKMLEKLQQRYGARFTPDAGWKTLQ